MELIQFLLLGQFEVIVLAQFIISFVTIPEVFEKVYFSVGVKYSLKIKNSVLDFPGGPVDKNRSANAGYTGLIHGLGTMILHRAQLRAPMLCNERSHLNEKPAHCSQRVGATCRNQRKPVHSNEEPGLCNRHSATKKKINKIIKK